MSTSNWKSSHRKTLYDSFQGILNSGSDTDYVDTSEIGLDSDNYIEKKLESIFQRAKTNKDRIITERKFVSRPSAGGGENIEFLASSNQYSSAQVDNDRKNSRLPFQKITSTTNNKSPHLAASASNFETNNEYTINITYVNSNNNY